MIRLGKRDAMIIVCGGNRIRLYKFREIDEKLMSSKPHALNYCKYLAAHYRTCGRIIKLFVKAAS